MKIAILGAGAFGTALGGVLAANGQDIDYYDKKLEQTSLSQVLEGAKLMVLCVPSQVVSHLLPHLPKEIPLVVATKGILTERVFADFRDYMVLSGPGFADDIKAGKETWLTTTDERLTELFAADFMKFDYTHDRLGVLMCGALKNVYAIGAGYRKLAPGSSKSQQFITGAAEEMRRILATNGADGGTVDLACGRGDLALTCGPGSRNYAFGLELRELHDSSQADTELRNGSELAMKHDSKTICSGDAAPHQHALERSLACHFPHHATVEGLSTIRRIREHEISLPDNIPILQEILNLQGA